MMLQHRASLLVQVLTRQPCLGTVARQSARGLTAATCRRDPGGPAACRDGRLARSRAGPGVAPRCYSSAAGLVGRRESGPGSAEELYESVYRRSLQNPAEFWAEAADALTWTKRWNKVVDNSQPPFTKWFVGGELNVCYNAVDRHVQNGHGDQTAIIHDSPMLGTISHISYKQLLDQVSKFASVLSSRGVARGGRVLIYMPMIPEAIVAMLACARLGAAHAVVFGGFASKELATRISHVQPAVIVSSNGSFEPPDRLVAYKPLLDKAIELSDYKPPVCIIFNRTHSEKQFPRPSMIPGRDFDYLDLMQSAGRHDCVPIPAMDTLYLMHTSGTTGLPKAVVRPSGGHAVSLQWTMKNIIGVKPHETWLAASDLGWVVGHSFIVYGPLLNCNTTVLYEGKPIGTPDASAYHRLIHTHNIASMFCAPTSLRAVRKGDPQGTLASRYPIPTLRAIFVVGEHCDHETADWGKKHFGVPILDNWWQTETGSPITATCVGLGNSLNPPSGVAGKPVPGFDVRVIRDDMTECAVGELGNIVVKLPLPPGNFSTLYKGDDRFVKTYFTKFPGYYDSMDAGFIADGGYVAVMSRSDDVINVAGHRLSTGALEEAVLEHNDVMEAAVVGLPDKLKGHVPIGLCVLKVGIDPGRKATLAEEIIATVREHVGPVASFKQVVIVTRLPKTRSGKIARNTLAAMCAGKSYKIPVTIEDAAVYPEIEIALRAAGYEPGSPAD